MREAPDGGARYDRKMRFLTGFAQAIEREIANRRQPALPRFPIEFVFGTHKQRLIEE